MGIKEGNVGDDIVSTLFKKAVATRVQYHRKEECYSTNFYYQGAFASLVTLVRSRAFQQDVHDCKDVYVSVLDGLVTGIIIHMPELVLASFVNRLNANYFNIRSAKSKLTRSIAYATKQRILSFASEPRQVPFHALLFYPLTKLRSHRYGPAPCGGSLIPDCGIIQGRIRLGWLIVCVLTCC